jgi:photosystem II stability/assembly factor-like uncharacterized protein
MEGDRRRGGSGVLGRGSLRIALIAGVIVFAALAGCKAHVAVVKAVSSDRNPPYAFIVPSSPLSSIAFAADGLKGWTAGAAGAIYHTDDGGKTWQMTAGVPVNADFRCISVSSDGATGVVVGDAGIILRSGDGLKWERVVQPPVVPKLYACVLSADGRLGWTVGANGALLRSVDGARTWQQVPNIPVSYQLRTVAFSPDSQHGWAAGDEGVVLLTGDAGKTWQQAGGIPKNENFQGITFLPDGRHGWVVGDFGIMWETADGGRTWQQETRVPQEDYLNSIAFTPDGRLGWAVGDGGAILRSTDGGQSWEQVSGVPTSENIYALVVSSDARRIWATGVFGTTLRSDDGGTTWQRSSGPPTENAINSLAFSADTRRVVAVGDFGTIVRSADGGDTWQSTAGIPAGATLESVAMSPDGQKVWAVGADGFIARSVDAGQNWEQVARPSGKELLHSVAFAADGQRGWAVGAAGTILNSTDGGQTWQKHAGVPTSLDLTAVAFMPDGLHGWAVGNIGTILRTTNGGQSWKLAEGMTALVNLHSVAFAPDGQRVWAAGDNITVLRSADGGRTWQITDSGDGTGAPINSIAFAADGERGWVVGPAGSVMRTVDGGLAWWFIGSDDKVGTLNTVAVSSDGKNLLAAGDHGTFLRSSSSPADMRPFDGEVSLHLDEHDGIIQPVVSVEGRKATAGGLYVNLSLSGPRATGDLAKGFMRTTLYGIPIAGWKASELGPGVYTCHVEVGDGWNVVTGDFQFGNGAWARFNGFMGWDIVSSDPLKFAKEHGTQNLVLLLVLYCLGIAGLFVFAPSWFVMWHEKAAPLIAVLPLPGKATDKVTQIAGLFLISRSRALDAVVRQFAPVALAEMEKLPEAATRKKWVAAPIQIEDEVFDRASNPSDGMSEGELYIRGLTELKRHLVNRRWWLSIEGPGGVGKSALAFQLARWFAAERPESRLHLPQAIPVYLRSLKEGVDKEALAELRRILELPKMSVPLSEALLRHRRVLVLIDGISEKTNDIEALELGPLNPSKSGELTHLAVMTSRRRIQIPEVVKILPRSVDLGSIDEVLTRYLDDVVGAGRFTPSQREAIRDSLKAIMKEISRENDKAPEIPMVFVKLLIQRADEVLAKDEAATPGGDDSRLPKDLAGLVDGYLSSLLESHPDGMAEAGQARRAAIACVCPDGVPKARPLAAYTQRTVTHEQLEALVITGLIVREGTLDDPQYKFALDPIAEYLAAKEFVIAVRDGKMTAAQLKGECAPFVSVSDVPAKMAQIARALGVNIG